MNKLICVAAWCFFLAACTDGGDIGDDARVPVNEDDVTSPSGEILGGLTGRVITMTGTTPVEFDMATGRRQELDIFDQLDYFIERGEGNPAKDGARHFSANDAGMVRYVETAARCLDDLSGCVAILDEQYQLISAAPLRDIPYSRKLKLSRSGLYLSIVQHHRVGKKTQLGIVNSTVTAGVQAVELDIDIPSRSSDLDRSPPVMEWGLDDRVLYTVSADVRPIVYITKPGSLTVDRRIRLPEIYKGRIASMDVHPDGNQVVFQYNSRGSENRRSTSSIMILDLETLDIRHPVIDIDDAEKQVIGDTFTSYFRIPKWSPDGKYIMFWIKYISSNFLEAPTLGAPDVMLVIPADSDRLVIQQHGNPSSFEPPVIALKFEREDEDFRYDWGGVRGYDWVK